MTMTCDVSGAPPPAITWTQDGVRVSAAGRGRSLTKGDRVLQLGSARLEDAGVYVCSAENVVGVDRRLFRLSVLGRYTTSTTNYSQTALSG